MAWTTLFKARSTNGRYGLDLIAREPLEPIEAQHNSARRLHIFPGSAKKLALSPQLNTAIDTFVLMLSAVHPEDPTFTIVTEDAEPVMNCEVVHRIYLQSHTYCTLLVAKPGAVWRDFGYRRRSSCYFKLDPDGKANMVQLADFVEDLPFGMLKFE